MFRKLGFASICVGVLALLFTVHSASAQNESAPRARIDRDIDERDSVELRGNTHAEAKADNDRGEVENDFPMEHMLLQLRRSPEQEQALQRFIDELQTKGSPNFHQWITAQQFGARFGLAEQDLDKITDWLERHGFKVNVVYPSGMVIDFSGTAEQVRETFKTEIHRFEPRGEKHIANSRDPRLPAALAPVIVGIVSLHDFKPHAMHAMHKTRPKFTFSDSIGTTFALVPADLATIYNLNPLFSAGYSGQGQKIVVIEDTDVFRTSDWNTFRSKLGLSKYSSGSFSTVHPAPSSGANNCRRPGVIAPNDAEAILDAEWASAAAPNAAIVLASCADTTTTFGGLIALQNLINASSRPPAIMSISYGQCETQNGAPANAAYNSAYQQAVSEGVSVFVAAGDSGAAGCDNSVSEATHGVGVNAFASTPYNVAVGGTDFSDTFSSTNSNYWNSTNTSSYGSALSYIPEIPWNDSCAGVLISTYEGYATPYGSNGFCDSPLGGFLLTTVSGGGGPSGCATGTPSISGVVSGSCQGWPKPSWQSVLGNPRDGVRDTPDISLFAADGLWSHYYVFCWSDTANGGAACSGAPSGWSGAGGTSFASPIMAGIQALVNQKAGGRQGNPNPAYYALAATEYGSNGTTSCNSSNGTAVAGSCIFYDVTQGDMDVNCSGNANCYLPSGTAGVLSTSNNSYNPAYGTTTGWDFATGIGSVNAYNLVNNWPSSAPNYILSTSPSSLTLSQGANGTSTITVNAQNGFGGNVTLSASGLPSGVTASFSPNPANTASTLTLTANSAATIGTATVTITGTSGSLTNTTTIALTVNSVGNYTLSASPNSLSITQGANGTSTIRVTSQGGFSSGVTLSASGLPSGVTASFNANPTTTTSTLTLAASGTASMGTGPVTITGTSGSLTNTTTITLTVTPPPNYVLSASPSSLSVTQGAGGTSTIAVAPQNGFSGSVTLSASGLPSGVTAIFNANPATTTSTLTLTASSTAITGMVTVTIKGTSGGLTNTTTLTLTVIPAPLLTVWQDQDVGQVGVAGSASYANGTFTVKGSGQQIWGTADQMNFMYQPLSGDGTIVARLVSLQGGLSVESAGVMIRETLNTDSTNAYTAYGSNSLIYFDERLSTAGASTSANTPSPVTLPYWVKLLRSGSTFSGYTSSDGVNWVQIGTSQTINMAQNAYFGLVVNSDNNSALATATFDNVSTSSTSAPAPVITNVSATTGSIGSQVVITGTGFGTPQGSSLVTLSGGLMTINAWSGTSITITIPSGATSGPLAVSVAPTMNNSNPVTFTVSSQSLPTPWQDQDVGQVGVAGSASYANGTFTVKGSGQQIWGTADQMNFMYQPLSGDGTIVARLVSLQGGLSVESAGVMIRETLNTDSTNAYTAYGSNSLIYFDERLSTAGASTSANTPSPVTLPYWVKLLRSGSTFSGYTSSDGVNWVQIGTSQTINMAQNAYFGLVVNSDNNSALATATFDNVSTSSTSAPAPVITNVSATTGSIGSQVVITGTGFGTPQGSSLVTLSGGLMTINAWSGTSITITIPSGATSGPLAVSVAPTMNNSNPVTFTVN
jgi:pro-kumamolisin-like protein/IPT/TIG domain-containing protein